MLSSVTPRNQQHLPKSSQVQSSPEFARSPSPSLLHSSRRRRRRREAAILLDGCLALNRRQSVNKLVCPSPETRVGCTVELSSSFRHSLLAGRFRLGGWLRGWRRAEEFLLHLALFRRYWKVGPSKCRFLNLLACDQIDETRERERERDRPAQPPGRDPSPALRDF